ncbi:MAG: GntR family transcriptional regulator [Polaromonas sp.]|nr:GntR family transcriptional regulator [Polaromonas sp.]
MTKPNDSLADFAYAKVKERIIFSEFKGGDSVDELMLAKDLELSRTPVREAVQRLAQEGLVRIIPRKGVLVTELSLDLMRQVFEARSPCEAQIVRLAARRAEPAEIREMEEALADVDMLITERRFRELLETDRRFHTALAQASKNRLLQEMFEKVYSLGARFWYLTLPERDVDEIRNEMALHVTLLDAVKSRDPEKAALALLTAIEDFPERISGMVRTG